MQLIEVLSAGDQSGVKVVLSDGHTRIKARLVSSVVDILEAELDEQLGKETTNDVFRLNRFVVVSTGVGPEDEWIQLTIEDIEYLYHRRRNLGQPTPVEQDSAIRPLITDVNTLLNPELEVDEEENDDLQSQEAQSEPASVAVRRSSPTTVPASPPQQSPQDKATVRKRRKPHHTLEVDGFELRAGVNLQGPVKAQRKDDDTLLKLLRRERPRAEVVNETPLRPPDRPTIQGHGLFARIASGEEHSRHSTPEEMDTHESPAADSHEEPQNIPSSPPKPDSSPSNNPRSQGSRQSPAQATISELSPEPRNNSRNPAIPGSLESTKLSTQPKSTRSTQVKSRIPYGRRKIPANQRALLGKETSWLPSLPGRSFPQPNVPIELLKKWNAAPSSSRQTAAVPGPHSVPPSQELRSGNASQHEAASSQQDDESSKSPSESSNDSDEVPPSQWPLSQEYSPRQPRPDLPPDSSIGNVVRGTPDDLEVEPPRALKAAKSGQRVAVQAPGPPRLPSARRPPEAVPDVTEATPSHQNSPMKPSPSRGPQRQESSHMRPSPIPSPSHTSYGSAASRPMPSSWKPSPLLSDSRHTTRQATGGASRDRDNAQRPPSFSSRPSSMLPGLHLTGTNGSHHAGNSARPSQEPPAGRQSRSHPSSQPANQPSRSSQNMYAAPVPPRESIYKTKSEWRDQHRKQQER